MSKLVIVESPTKAKTIAQYLGKDFLIKSSYGHIRDLPKSELGVDTERDFKPRYVIPTKVRKTVSNLKKRAQKAKEIILATDEDREGEAIAWHLTYALKIPKEKTKRIVFHEITKKAIQKAFKNPRKIDIDLVDAQQARRVLDRLVGYKLSPFLWEKIYYGLSAGRVQSVALRLIVDKEREIKAFKPQEYWTIEAELKKTQDGTFITKLIKQDGKAIPKLGIKNKKQADEMVKNLKGATYKVLDIKKTEKKRSPFAPFTTSTLQQEAARRLGFTAKQTMMFAQQLYEGIEIEGKSQGLITYMRTDSVTLAKDFLGQAQKFIKEKYGPKYSLAKPKIYRTKSKLAQEAHEAVRPTSPEQTPESTKQYLNKNQYKLYTLVWQRTIASQMAEAVIDSLTYDITTSAKSGSAPGGKNYIFRALGSTIKFDGFLKVYGLPFKETILPPLEVDEILELIKLISSQHFTQPPPRYTEATLVKTLEQNGIGRPSTYALIISTIQERGYVEKKERKFYPKEIGILVNDLLVKHFPEIVDIKFTAHMEEDLDKIAQDKIEWVSVVREFYEPFAKHLEKKEKEVKKEEVAHEKTKEKCPKCGAPLIIKWGRFGKFLACSKFPECKYSRPLPEEEEELKKLQEEYKKEKCEKCGAPLTVKRGKYGYFLACSKYPECNFTKPILKKVGVKCPKCKKGDIIEKKSKKGRLFYACSQYPKCKFALWQRPTGEKCPKCKSLLVWAGKDKVKCSNKECNYIKSLESKND